MYRIRIPIGLGLLATIAGLAALDYYTKTCFATVIVLAFLTLGAMAEFFNILSKRNYNSYKIFALIGAGIGIFLHILASKNYGIGVPMILEIYNVMFIGFLIMGILLNVEQENVLENTFCTLFGLFYLYFTLCYMVKIRLLGIDPNIGLIYLLLTVLVSKSMDIGGYLVGKAFGKHKLFPSVSPKKSWEGFLGGILLAIAVTFGLREYFPILEKLFSIWHVLVYSILMGVLSIWGDFAESLVKRRCQVKDSNDLIPEFGGILDMMDSMTFTAPFSYYFLMFIGGLYIL